MPFRFNIRTNVKDRFNDPIPSSFSDYTHPNGTIRQDQDGQKTFVPNDLPPPLEYDQDLIMLLAEAERTVGELKGIGASLSNPHILLRSHIKHEAVTSSKIEGTLASIQDLHKYEAFGIEKKMAEKLGLREVENHVRALEWAIHKIKIENHDVDLGIIRGAHKILMDGVRGQETNPGEFRKQQNLIVETGPRKNKIVYTPPPPEIVMKLLQKLEKFCTSEHDDIPVLIQCAMIHYQFEAIHPFGDGNGRIGRLIILLILCKRNLLPEPLLYLSAFFDEHLRDYYGGLLEVSRKSKWYEWVWFFLDALVVQSLEAIKTIERLGSLYGKYRQILHNRNASGNAIALMESLFANPYTSVPVARRILKVSHPAARNTIDTLIKDGILNPAGIFRRSHIFVAAEIDAVLQPE